MSEELIAMSKELIVYPSLGVRVRRSGAGWLIEQFNDDKQWSRIGSSPNTEALLRNLAARLDGLPTSAEAWQTLTEIAESERPVARPVKDGLAWLARTPVNSTDTSVPKHVAGKWAPSPAKPPAPRPVPAPVPATERERYVFDAERVKVQTLESIEQAQREALAEAEAGARKAIAEGIGRERAKAIMEAETPVRLDEAITEAEAEYQDAVKAGNAADQLNAIRTKKALQLARSRLTWHPTEETAPADVL